MNELKIKSVESIGNNLKVHFKCSGFVGRFFKNDVFFSKYATSIEGVPESILVIPFLATCLPVVWASKADIYVEEIDEEFFNGLKEIKSYLQNFYPRIGFGGNIHANKIVKSNVNDLSKSMILFSGGVDSLTTYIRHRSENPILVYIHDSNFTRDNYKSMENARKSLQSFSKKTKCKHMTIQSNFIEINNSILLNSYYKRYTNETWWNGIQHGLALLGLCAPLTYSKKIKKLYIASSHTQLFSKPWGSHPDIDNNVKWAKTIVKHDGYELSRQDKILVIADYIRKEYPELYIRSCTKSTKGINCSVCEKCSRTIMGLELAGIDPSKHGFKVNDDTFLLIMKKLLGGLFEFGENEQYMWEDLQYHCNIDKNFPHLETKKLANWLLNIDIEELVSKSNETTSLRKWMFAHIHYFKYFPDPLLKFIKYLYLSLGTHVR